AVYTNVVTVNGNGTYDTSTGTNPGGFVPTTVGTYEWVASYSGDANNNPVTSPLGDEPETVIPTTPMITTVASLTGGNVVGSAMLNDSAVLSATFMSTATLT